MYQNESVGFKKFKGSVNFTLLSDMWGPSYKNLRRVKFYLIHNEIKNTIYLKYCSTKWELFDFLKICLACLNLFFSNSMP